MLRLGYCLGVKSVVSIKETIMYQLEASKENPKSSPSLHREGDEQVLRATPSSTITFGIQSLRSCDTIRFSHHHHKSHPTPTPNPIQHHVQIASTAVLRPWQRPRLTTNSASLPLMGVQIPCSGCTVATCALLHGRRLKKRRYGLLLSN